MFQFFFCCEYNINMSNKLALLIGINYTGSDNELKGCINDVYRIKDFLISKCGYLENNIKMLTDETDKKPTAMNILNEIGNLIIAGYYNKSKELFIHYSGHGSYVKDTSGDELDNQDEALVPIDFNTAGFITDDLLHDYFVYLPADCKCICLFDCCHSGTILDLKYRYVKEGDNIIENEKSKIESDVILISGCKDVQTSADAFMDGKWAGAMTNAFLDTMEKYNYNITCFHLLKTMHDFMKEKGYEQIPQICSTKKVENTSLFTCSKPLPTPFMILLEKK